MKKKLVYLFLLLPFTLTAYEHTGGIRLDLNLEAPSLYGTVAEASSEDSLRLWYESRVNDLIHFSVDGGIAWDGYAGVAVNLNQEIEYLGVESDLYPDIRALNVFGFYNIFDYRLGRQQYSDPSGLLIAQPLDALEAGVKLGPGMLKASLGYSGLVHEKASDIAMTQKDLEEGSQRLIEGISYSLPELLGPYMNLTGAVTAQQDLSGDLNTLYFQLGAEGFLLPFLMYDSSFIYQAGSLGDLKSNGLLGDFRVLLVPGGSRSFISLGAFYTSGETWENRPGFYGEGANGDQNLFIPISTAASQGYVLQLDPGNITAFELLFSLSGSKKFAFELSTTTLLRTVDGPVSSTMVIDNGVSDLYIGQEGLMAFKFRPASDFGASINVGVLYPGEVITINEYLEDYLPVLPKIGFDLSFSF
ncbi:MAG: hypothetical protein PQJ58_15565 [Spirochaetales bacterium]|nr:hypothetical protein [Spirochaetales bacterium]